MSPSATCGSICRNSIEKTQQYRNDPDVQETLWAMNRQLQGLESELAERANEFPDPQLVFIAYVPRSGSTILSQLLARTGCFNYISNFQARYWLAPYVGGIVERNAAARICHDIPLESRHGLTPTVSSPNEFSYFWDHWLQLQSAETHTLDEGHWNGIDLDGLRRQIKLLGTLQPEPLFFKKEWLGLNAGRFLADFPTLKILHIRRDAWDVANSIARARRKVFGSYDHWWAARPANYCQLRELPWPEQIAGQIRGILEDTARWETAFSERFLSISYASLIENTHDVLGQIGEFLDVRLTVADIPRRLQSLPANKVPRRDQLRQALADNGLTPS